MIEIRLLDEVGSFAENKDKARAIRLTQILPALERGESITLDFSGIDSATQSFTHALLSDVIRQHGVEVIDKIQFKSCSKTVQKIIEIVFEYMQESLD